MKPDIRARLLAFAAVLALTVVSWGLPGTLPKGIYTVRSTQFT